MEHFIYKGGCGIHCCVHIETFRRKAGWTTDEQLWVISNIVFSYTTKKLKNKAILILYALLCGP